MRPYHPANLKLQPFSPWRVVALAWAGKLLGIQFKIDGIPYGAPYQGEYYGENVDFSAALSAGAQVGKPE